MSDLTATNGSGQILSTAVILPTGVITSEDSPNGAADINTPEKARTYDVTTSSPYGPDIAIRHRNFLLELLSRGVGAGLTTVNEDGDLSAVATASTRQSVNPLANTTGAATTRWSLTALFRWFLGIFQDVTEPTHVRIAVYETYTQLGDLTVNANTGSYTPLPSFAGRRVEVTNISDTAINYRRADANTVINMLLSGQSIPLSVNNNATEIEMRSTTASAKQVSVTGITLG